MAAPTDDPMGGGDRTILRPGGAGARRAPQPLPTGAPPSPPPAPSAAPPPRPAGAPPVGNAASPLPGNLSDFLAAGSNALLQAATPLLVLALRLRSTVSVPDVGGLRRQVFEEVRAFETRARSAGAAAEDVLAARYALCTALDEAVLNTPWGAQSEWAAQTLLIAFHREAFGGEKFFQILERIMADPRRYIDLMELMYAFLALGFEGRYRLEERGAARLLEVQRDLYQRIRAERGPVSAALSPAWAGVPDARNRVARYVPLWIVALAALVILMVTFIALYAGLGRRSEPVMGALAGIGIEPMYAGTAVASNAPRLKALLAPQELAGQVQIEELGDRTTVTLPAADLFASGSASLTARYQPVIAAIAAALNKVPGRVTVIGHTDDQPVHSLSFANNNDLSRARALSVVALLRSQLESPGRLEAVGRGSDQPRFLPPDLPANRARNRRVEIIQWLRS
jgi:type VI secretion system protein ImpK